MKTIISFLFFFLSITAWSSGEIPISTNFLLGSQLSLDARQVAATTSARDAIPTIERYEGLSVYIQDGTFRTFQLQNGITNSNWVLLPSSNALLGGATPSPSPTTLALRDSNADTAFNNVALNVNVVNTSSGPFTLTSASNHYQNLTGSTSTTVTLPSGTTLVDGVSFVILNSSTGVIAVNDFTGNPMGTIEAATTYPVVGTFTLTNNTTTHGQWISNTGIQTPGASGNGSLVTWNDVIGKSLGSSNGWSINPTTGTLDGFAKTNQNITFTNGVSNEQTNYEGHFVNVTLSPSPVPTASPTTWVTNQEIVGINVSDLIPTAVSNGSQITLFQVQYGKTLGGSNNQVSMMSSEAEMTGTNAGIINQMQGMSSQINNSSSSGIIRNATLYQGGQCQATGTDPGNDHFCVGMSFGGNITSSGGDNNYGAAMYLGASVTADAGKSWAILSQMSELSEFSGPIQLDNANLTLDEGQLISEPASGIANLSLHTVTDPSGGPFNGDFWNSTASNALKTSIAGLNHTLSSNMFTQTSSVTVANTVTATTLIGSGVGIVTLPANYLVVGKSFELHATGIFSAAAIPPTLQLKVLLGGATFLDTGAQTTVSNFSNKLFELNSTCTTRATGVSGNLFCQGKFVGYDPSLGTFDVWPMVTATTTTLNTTASQAISVTAQWGTASASSTITVTNLSVNLLN